jgi:hypothetical protein
MQSDDKSSLGLWPGELKKIDVMKIHARNLSK